MCGRYTLLTAPQTLADLFKLSPQQNLPEGALRPRYNAAPMQNLPIVVKDRIGMARWGFLPEWAEKDDPSLCVKMINARSETVSGKASYRDSWARGRRCLVPASGFYEWHKAGQERGANVEHKHKQPYYIHAPEMPCMAFAGLWAKAHNVLTFTILTKEARGPIADIHHRMPVILSPSQAQQWFAESYDGVRNMIDAAGQNSGAPLLDVYPVGKAVGNIRNDDAGLIEPVELAAVSASDPSQISLL